MSAPEAQQPDRDDLLRTLADNVPAMIAYYEPQQLRCVFANKRYAEANGWSVDTILGKTVREAIGEEAWRLIEPQVARVLKGEKVEYVRPMTLPNGERRFIEVNLIPHFDERARMVGAFVLITDITRHQEAERAIRDSEERMRKFAAATNEGIFFHKNGVLTDVNEALLAISGHTREELIGRNTLEFVAPEWVEAATEYMRGEREDPYEIELVRKNGRRVAVEIVAKSVRSKDEVSRMGVLRDITARKHAETRLRESEIRLRTLIEQSPVGISFSRDGTTIDVNARYAEMFGYRNAAEVLDTPYLDRIAPRARPAVSEIIERRRAGHDAPAEYETVGLRRDGSEFPVFVSARRIVLEDGPLTVACMLDFTERKQFEDRIRQLAFFDQLTRLPNRELLQDRLRQAISASVRTDRHGALLLFGLDNFKSINETLGHAAGDALLQQVATRLAGEVRDGDTVARMGGDEFMVLLEDLGPQPWAAAAHAESFGLKIMRMLSSPQGPLGDQVHVSCSVGATLLPGQQMGAHDLIQQADIALNQAKAAGRNTLRFFDPHMQQVVSSRAALEGELRKAVGAGQFLLHYQPQVDATGRRIGAEALLRWNHPVRGLVPPGEYIGLAEETQMILPIGEWVIDTACAQLAAWRDAPDTRELTLAVNVSPLQFQQPQFAEQVRRAIGRHGIEARRLKLELTETMLQGDVQKTVMTMRRLKEEGVQFSLDDFGTGYSSLQYLKQLPLDQLKIDQTFVRDIVTDPNDRAIVATIIAIARHLGLDVIAEGVETQAQLEVLRECGCSRYQGYLFGRPAEAQRLFGT